MPYWDTSALAKLYLPEADAAMFVKLAVTEPGIITSLITRYEMRCLFSRKCALEGAPPAVADAAFADFERDIAKGRISIVPFAEQLDSAMRKLLQLCGRASPAILLRTLDAIHLAAALSSGTTTIVTTDARMRKAGLAAGLTLTP